MSMIEATPQRHKNYDGRKQDHGDAAEQRSRVRDRYEEGYDQRGNDKRDQDHLRIALLDSFDHETTVPPEDEYDDGYVDDDAEESESIFDIEAFDDYDDEESFVDINQDGFITPEDLGLKSRREIGKLMARRVTLDPEFDREDDEGDSDYPSPLRIHNLR